MKTIILAGGKGSRLHPYTHVIPKPLLPVGEKPILELIIRKLKREGFKEFIFAVSHLSSLFQAFFGNGARFGVKIEYFEEETPLGTAGCLGLIELPNESFLVMNGDVLTTLHFPDFVAAHFANGGLATICTYKKEETIDLGVLEIQGHRIVDYREKPEFTYHVSTGIYCFRPDVKEFITPGDVLDFPELILRLIRAGCSVCSYPLSGQWYDIGRHSDYEMAQKIAHIFE